MYDLKPRMIGPRPRREPQDRGARSWMEFHLRDGRVLYSYNVNWNDVPLHELEAVYFQIKHQKVGLRRRDCPQTRFFEFVVFRTAGFTHHVVNDGRGGRQLEVIPFHSWTVGWTDGITEYLDEFCVKTGQHLRRYTEPRDFSRNPTHWHPESRRIIAASRVPEITGGVNGQGE